MAPSRSQFLASMFAVFIAVSVVTCWVSLKYLRGPSTSSHLQGKDANDAVVIATRLPLVHNPQKLAAIACRDINIYEDQLAAWKRRIVASNSDQISSETILRKVVVHSAFSGKAKTGAARLVCLIATVDSDSRARKVYETWAQSCDQFLFIATKSEIAEIDRQHILEVHPPNKENKNTWQRLRSTLRHVSVTPALRDNDFFLIVSDDSYVIVENLRSMLAEPYVAYLHAAATPLYMGHRMVQSGSNAPFVSGSGILLNRAAVQLFAAVSDNSNCDPNVNSEADDVLLAQCFRYHNVYPLNTQDVFGEDRHHMWDAAGVASIVRDPNIANWYPAYRKKVMPKGLDGVSRYSYHFHGLWEQVMDEYRSKISRS